MSKNNRNLNDYNKQLYSLPNEIQCYIWSKYYEKYVLSEIISRRCRNLITFHPYLDSVRCNATTNHGFYCDNCSFMAIYWKNKN